MARSERNVGWPGVFLCFSVLCAITLLVAENGVTGTAAMYAALCRWSVPGLFMVWGMTALEGGKSNLKTSFLGLFLPAFLLLVVWGALYALLSHLLGGGALTLVGLLAALRSAASGNTYFHLWVLYPLLGLYLVQPVLHRFTTTASKGEVLYFLLLCFVFTSALPVWSVFHPNGIIAAFLDRLQIHLVLGWVGYYVAGWFLRHYTIGRIAEFFIYVCGIVGIALTIWGDMIFGGGTALWRSCTSPGVVMTAVAICTLFRYVLGLSDERSRRQTAHHLGSFAFEVYLIHQIWPLLFRWLSIPALNWPPLILIPAAAVLYFVMSLPFGWLLSRLPAVCRLSPE